MANRILLRRDTAANWSTVDPVLAKGEIGLEVDTGEFRIGDGVQSWTERPRYANAAAIADEYATLLSDSVVAAQAQVALAEAQVELAQTNAATATTKAQAAAVSAAQAANSAAAAATTTDAGMAAILGDTESASYGAVNEFFIPRTEAPGAVFAYQKSAPQVITEGEFFEADDDLWHLAEHGTGYTWLIEYAIYVEQPHNGIKVYPIHYTSGVTWSHAAKPVDPNTVIASYSGDVQVRETSFTLTQGGLLFTLPPNPGLFSNVGLRYKTGVNAATGGTTTITAGWMRVERMMF